MTLSLLSSSILSSIPWLTLSTPEGIWDTTSLQDSCQSTSCSTLTTLVLLPTLLHHASICWTALWLQWSGMKVKISKCAALGLKASSGKKTDRLISLQSDHIPFTSHEVKFLGLHVDTPQDSSKLRAELLTKFNNMLDRVDSCPLTSQGFI